MILGLVDDSGSNNIERVGHRMAILDPNTKEFGIGFAYDLNNPDLIKFLNMTYRYGSYLTVHKELSAQSKDIVDIAWPSPGDFPIECFGTSSAPWSLSLGANYETPDKANITLTMTRARDNKTWVFDASTPSIHNAYDYINSSLDHLSVDGRNIIFRPNYNELGEILENDVFHVSLSGIKSSEGIDTTLTYNVNFFSLIKAMVDDPGGPGGSGDPADPSDPGDFGDPSDPGGPTDPSDPGTNIDSNQQSVEKDKAALTWNAIRGSNTSQTSVTTNMILPVIGTNGSTITWTSSNAAIVSTAGVVTRPLANEGNKSVKLTATISKGNVSDTAEFTITVIAQASAEPDTTPTGNVTTPTGTSTGQPTSTTVTDVSDVIPPVGDTWTNPYIDVAGTNWFYEAVRYVSSSSLMEGTASDKFSPNVTMSRAMLVTVLYRLEGKPSITAGSLFTDVASGQWYSDAISWANENRIVDGYSNGAFGINDPVTREQAVTILYRYAKSKGLDVSASVDLYNYIDMSNISGWALDAMKWAAAEGIIQGRTETSIAPQGTSTRAEVATIFMRYIENFQNTAVNFETKPQSEIEVTISGTTE